MQEAGAGTRIETDAIGFPMVYIAAVDAFVHWLPFTKIQLEYFLCERSTIQFDDAWYRKICAKNPRVTPGRITKLNYYESFATALTPSEVETIAEWLSRVDDRSYEVPTEDEWRLILQEVKGKPSIPSDQIPSSFERAGRLIEKLDAVARGEPGGNPTRDLQMFLSLGVVEWVRSNKGNQGWGGLGQATKKLVGDFHPVDELRVPIDIDARSRAYGFRLLRRAL